MTPRPLRFRAEAAIPAAGPRASRAGCTSDNPPPSSQGARRSGETELSVSSAVSSSTPLGTGKNKRTDFHLLIIKVLVKTVKIKGQITGN